MEKNLLRTLIIAFIIALLSVYFFGVIVTATILFCIACVCFIVGFIYFLFN